MLSLIILAVTVVTNTMAYDSKLGFLFWRPYPTVRVPVAPTPSPTGPTCFDNTTCSPANATNGSHPSPPAPPEGGGQAWLNDVEWIGYVYFMPVICLTGIILNSFTIFVLNKRQFKAPTYTYLSGLAGADVITCLFTLPLGMSRCGQCDMAQGGYPRLIYEVYVFMPFTNMSETMSAWMVMLLGIERLVTIKRKSTDRSYQKPRTIARYITVAVAVAAIALNMPYFFAVSVSETGDHPGINPRFNNFDENGLGFTIFSWIRASLVQFLPLLILIVLNCFLLHHLRRAHRRYRKLSVISRQSVRERAQFRLTWMLVGTVVLFIAGNIPVAMAYSVIFQAMFGREALYSDFYVTWRVVTHLISIACYGLDFIVYCVANPYFREACASALTCDRKKRKITDISSTSKEFISPDVNQQVKLSLNNSQEKNKY